MFCVKPGKIACVMPGVVMAGVVTEAPGTVTGGVTTVTGLIVCENGPTQNTTQTCGIVTVVPGTRLMVCDGMTVGPTPTVCDPMVCEGTIRVTAGTVMVC